MAIPPFIDKLAYTHLVEGKILMARSHGKDTWYNPGGKREPGETDQAALIREIKEELTVDLIPETIKHHSTYEAQAHGKPEGTIVRLTCYSAEYNGTLAASSEIAEIRFLGYADIALTSLAGRLIFQDLHAQGLLR
jgi:8-oxo-dGTP pyrophosphatase MutT (NUDIX family)